MPTMRRMKSETTLLCLLVVFMAMILLWTVASVRYVTTPGNSVPLYAVEYGQLEESLYVYYNEYGFLPDDHAWMNERDREAMRRTAGAITWDGETKAIGYEYDKPYPVNYGIFHGISFGLIPPEGPMGNGQSLSEEHIIHNAKLRVSP
jgi:hypothetical protein